MKTKLKPVVRSPSTRRRIAAASFLRDRDRVLLSSVLACALATAYGYSASAEDRELTQRFRGAIEAKNLSAVAAIVDHEAPDGTECSSALTTAAEVGDLAIVQYLVEHCRKIDVSNSACEKALVGGQHEVFRYLAGHASQSCPYYGLEIAARQGDREIQSTYLAFGTGLALRNAIGGKYLEEVRCLVASELSAHDLREAVLVAVEMGWDEGLPLLLQPQLPHEALNDALRAAAKRGSLSMVKTLVEHGADDLAGALCASNCSLALVSYLVEKGAGDLTHGLEACASKGDLAVVRYLVAHGASVEEAPLHASLQIGDVANRDVITSYFLEHGARAESLGFESLAILVRSGDLALLKKLVEKGADLRVQNQNREGLLGLAADPAMRAFLQSRGVTTPWGEHWFHVSRDVGPWLSRHYMVYFALGGLAYLGTSIYLREVTYRGRPLASEFGTVNGMLSAVVGLGASGSLITLAAVAPPSGSHQDYAGAEGAAGLAAIAGVVVGLAAGVPTGYYCRNFFKRNAVAYYAFPTTAFVVPLAMVFF
jgi:hypothetical protein